MIITCALSIHYSLVHTRCRDLQAGHSLEFQIVALAMYVHFCLAVLRYCLCKPLSLPEFVCFQEGHEDLYCDCRCVNSLPHETEDQGQVAHIHVHRHSIESLREVHKHAVTLNPIATTHTPCLTSAASILNDFAPTVASTI
jgi:hypothetical protein